MTQQSVATPATTSRGLLTDHGAQVLAPLAERRGRDDRPSRPARPRRSARRAAVRRLERPGELPVVRHPRPGRLRRGDEAGEDRAALVRRRRAGRRWPPRRHTEGRTTGWTGRRRRAGSRSPPATASVTCRPPGGAPCRGAGRGSRRRTARGRAARRGWRRARCRPSRGRRVVDERAEPERLEEVALPVVPRRVVGEVVDDQAPAERPSRRPWCRSRSSPTRRSGRARRTARPSS